MDDHSDLDKVFLKFKIGLFDTATHLSDRIEIIYRKDSPESFSYANEIFAGLTQKRHFKNVSMVERDYIPYNEEFTFENDRDIHRLFVNCK